MGQFTNERLFRQRVFDTYLGTVRQANKLSNAKCEVIVRRLPTKEMLGGLQALKERKVSTSFEYDDSDDGVFKGNEKKASDKLLGTP